MTNRNLQAAWQAPSREPAPEAVHAPADPSAYPHPQRSRLRAEIPAMAGNSILVFGNGGIMAD